MKNNFFARALLLASFSLLSFKASAEVTWFDGGSNLNELSLSATDGTISFGSGSSLSLSGGYLRRLGAFAVGGEFYSYSYSYKDFSMSSLSLIGIGNFVFDEHDFYNSFYALAGAGIGSTVAKFSSESSSDNKFGFRIGGGKRTMLTKSIDWRPEIYVEKVADYDAILVLRLINLGFVW